MPFVLCFSSYRQNVAVPMSQVNFRVIIVEAGLLFLSLFWGSLVITIYNFSTYLHRLPQLQPKPEYGDGLVALINVAINYVPTLILLIILQLLPWVFYLVSYNYERLKTHSEVQASITSRYFFYQMVSSVSNMFHLPFLTIKHAREVSPNATRSDSSTVFIDNTKGVVRVITVFNL